MRSLYIVRIYTNSEGWRYLSNGFTLSKSHEMAGAFDKYDIKRIVDRLKRSSEYGLKNFGFNKATRTKILLGRLDKSLEIKIRKDTYHPMPARVEYLNKLKKKEQTRLACIEDRKARIKFKQEQIENYIKEKTEEIEKLKKELYCMTKTNPHVLEAA